MVEVGQLQRKIVTPPTPPGASKSAKVVQARPFQVISLNGTLNTDIGTLPVVRRSVRNMCSDRPINMGKRISKKGHVRNLEDPPNYISARHVPVISPLGFVHIHVDDPYRGITDEQIMEIFVLRGISLGSLSTSVW